LKLLINGDNPIIIGKTNEINYNIMTSWSLMFYNINFYQPLLKRHFEHWTPVLFILINLHIGTNKKFSQGAAPALVRVTSCPFSLFVAVPCPLWLTWMSFSIPVTSSQKLIFHIKCIKSRLTLLCKTAIFFTGKLFTWWFIIVVLVYFLFILNI
jgi:hypothetical protein